MKKQELIDLGVSAEIADKVLALHGKDIESHKTANKDLQAKFDTANTQLTEANKQIESFKGMNIDEIKKNADEYKVKFEQAQQESAKQLADLKFNHALESALTGAKAKNVKSVSALLEMDKLKLNDDGTVAGLDDQLKAIREKDAYLFSDSKEPPKIVMGGKSQGTVVSLSMEQIKGMSPADINKNWDAVQATLAAQKK